MEGIQNKNVCEKVFGRTPGHFGRNKYLNEELHKRQGIFACLNDYQLPFHGVLNKIKYTVTNIQMNTEATVNLGSIPGSDEVFN